MNCSPKHVNVPVLNKCLLATLPTVLSQYRPPAVILMIIQKINLFNARPPVCTFDILTLDNSGWPLAGSTPRNHQDSQPAASSINRNSNKFMSPKPFKPYNLPRFVKGSNVHTFLQLSNSSMEGATKRQKATTVKLPRFSTCRTCNATFW